MPLIPMRGVRSSCVADAMRRMRDSEAAVALRNDLWSDSSMATVAPVSQTPKIRQKPVMTSSSQTAAAGVILSKAACATTPLSVRFESTVATARSSTINKNDIRLESKSPKASERNRGGVRRGSRAPRGPAMKMGVTSSATLHARTPQTASDAAAELDGELSASATRVGGVSTTATATGCSPQG
eukprot:Amastigsp_a668_28.p3 type:complete len:184 gc:universal Amastigsp_a668_28:961-410(-)